MKKVGYLLYLILFSTVIWAQNNQVIDSLVIEADKHQGKEKGEILARLFWEYRGADNEKASAIANQVMELAKQSNDQLLLARAWHIQGLAMASYGEFSKAIQNLETSLEIVQSLQDTSQIASVLNSLGILNHNQSNYSRALDFYLRRIPYLRENEKTAIATNYNNIGMIQEAIKDYPKALEYFQKALGLHRATGNKRMEGGTLVNIGIINFNLKKYDEALIYLQQGVLITKDEGDKMTLSIAYESKGNVYREQKKYKLAEEAYQESLQLSKDLQDTYGIASTTRNLGETFLNEKRYEQAMVNLKKADDLAELIGSKSIMMDSRKLLAQAYFETQNLKNAYQYLTDYQVLKDSIFNETKSRQIRELQTKYESEIKDQQINLLNSEKELQAAALSNERLIRNVSISSVVMIVLIAFLLIKNYQEKIRNTKALALKNEEINSQQILQLQKDKKLEVMEAMIVGEEKERRRIAQELHDGLLGQLAAIKMQFDGIGSESNRDKFRYALNSLDGASIEVRRIAHNLMPQILLKFGLVEALVEFVNNIKRANYFTITFTHSGFAQRVNPIIELSLYRTIQELTNNIVKHARASVVLIQMNLINDLLMVTVEDNGVGFIVDDAEPTSGIGLGNIISRMKYLGGKIDIRSDLGKGTYINIEIDVSRELSLNT
ncbi:MAG TPA: sensor histidine kinase [Cyclobacteriaceae bacterium]|jgi:two-component system NarL family sensor kinase|nr:sensor histidine kinase [Cyclobacteriaceae bacterium]HRF35322.1 sensor histidine kinase [Cyclobacteriaceae bacterium]